MPEKLLKVGDAATFLGISTSCLYRKVASQQVPCVRIGRLVRFDPAQLREWAAKQMKGE